MNKAIFFWSGGKDSSLCLYRVLQAGLFDVQYLLTTVNSGFKRISMHGVREELLDLQAASIGIPLLKMYVKEGTNEEYEHTLQQTFSGIASEGISHVIFGDIFLEDLRTYRENNLSKLNLKAVFPLWKQDTTALIHEFLNEGFKTITCCTNDAYQGKDWVGKEIDHAFVNELPSNVDPCGENGEYHTFCYDGPIFKYPLKIITGEKIYRPLEVKTESSTQTKGFWFIDLVAV